MKKWLSQMDLTPNDRLGCYKEAAYVYTEDSQSENGTVCYNDTNTGDCC